MPRVYYGLQTSSQTYRFTEDAEFTVTIDGAIGTVYELYSSAEPTNEYIAAIYVKSEENTLKIVVKGDYTATTNTFNAINMSTGATTTITINDGLTLQDASSLLDYPPQDNGNKQITVIHSIETNSDNVIYASIDYNNDGIFNWIEIGRFVDGEDGKCIYGVNGANYDDIRAIAKVGDTLVFGAAVSGLGINIGDMLRVTQTNPFSLEPIGNVRGPQGETGATGQDGADGADGYTPYIQDGYWYINGVNTNVKAIGTDGTNGTNGQSFQMQSGLYSTPDNWGESGNVDGDGNPLLQLPTLPQTNITGKGYVVYDPLTTPLAPYYDLYYANNGDTEWTIIHPFSGIAGTNGTNGSTPYIQNNNWYIDGVNTGVPATGPQGPAGPGVPSGGTAGQVLKKVSGTDYDTTWGDAGGGYYSHIITISSPTIIGSKYCVAYIISTRNTAYDASSLASFLYNKGFTGGTTTKSKFYPTTSYFFPTITRFMGPDIELDPDISLYSTNGIDLKSRAMIERINLSIDFDNKTFTFGTTNRSNFGGTASVDSDTVTPL